MKRESEKEKLNRIITVIDSTQEMLRKLKSGLLSGDPPRGLGKLAQESAIALTIIEMLLTESAGV